MVAQAAKSSVVAESVEESIRRHKQARNADYVDYDADKPLEERTLWQRVTRIWSIARPNYVALKLGALVVFIGVQVALDDLSFGVWLCFSHKKRKVYQCVAVLIRPVLPIWNIYIYGLYISLVILCRK